MVSGSGTITLDYATMFAVIRCVVTSAVRHGFKRIFVLNGHGGNIATTNAAFYEIYTGYGNIFWEGDVGRPTPGMLTAMSVAEVGDDVWGDDPTVNRLQALMAEMTHAQQALDRNGTAAHHAA